MTAEQMMKTWNDACDALIAELKSRRKSEEIWPPIIDAAHAKLRELNAPELFIGRWINRAIDRAKKWRPE